MKTDISKITEVLRPLFPYPPDVALVLGSGLGDFAKTLENRREVLTAELPDYPRSTVPGHVGAIVTGEIAGKKLLCFQGRIHLYEGYSVEEIVLPIRLAAQSGVRILILTNAAGGISRHLHPGSLMLIEDQIDLQFRRKVDPRAGREGMPRKFERGRMFSDGVPFSERLMRIAEGAALEMGIQIRRGVLGALLGPSYETPAEVRMWSLIAVDAACMSTVAEAAEGAHLGMEVLGISCITNRAAGLSGAPLDHAEVIEVANRVKSVFETLLKAIIKEC